MDKTITCFAWFLSFNDNIKFTGIYYHNSIQLTDILKGIKGGQRIPQAEERVCAKSLGQKKLKLKDT